MAVSSTYYYSIFYRTEHEVSTLYIFEIDASSRILHSLVFVEAQRQMAGLMDRLGRHAFAPASVMNKLSTHMIAGSGFGQYMDWSDTKLLPGESLGQARDRKKVTTLASVVETFGEHLLPMIIFPAWLLKALPSPTMNIVGNGKEKFEMLVRAMVQKIRDDSQKESIAGSGVSRKSDLLSNLVTAPPSNSGGTFSEKDIIGNVFALAFAAEETTSSALQVGLILLAMHTDIQVALQKEVDEFCANKPIDELMDYKTEWPKMRNLMAFMVCYTTFTNCFTKYAKPICSSKPNVPTPASQLSPN
jgi:cytochrome P450